ncbi:MAG: hypothetical protein BZY82_07910 [SAR202 cluster bacterium Io17-Chloro-G3]|nr:MAG: hypothetical protein BZY82_07910 [SAR202 cluster bacterium Io17-Chloro-G3]
MFHETGQSFFISINGRRAKVIAIAASGAIVTEPIKAAKIQQMKAANRQRAVLIHGKDKFDT